MRYRGGRRGGHEHQQHDAAANGGPEVERRKEQRHCRVGVGSSFHRVAEGTGSRAGSARRRSRRRRASRTSAPPVCPVPPGTPDRSPRPGRAAPSGPAVCVDRAGRAGQSRGHRGTEEPGTASTPTAAVEHRRRTRQAWVPPHRSVDPGPAPGRSATTRRPSDQHEREPRQQTVDPLLSSPGTPRSALPPGRLVSGRPSQATPRAPVTQPSTARHQRQLQQLRPSRPRRRFLRSGGHSQDADHRHAAVTWADAAGDTGPLPFHSLRSSSACGRSAGRPSAGTAPGSGVAAR